MAGKKAKKRSYAPAKKEEECACCSSEGMVNIRDWLLIIIGAIGLANVLGFGGMLGFGGIFDMAWPVLVLVIVFVDIMQKGSCTC